MFQNAAKRAACNHIENDTLAPDRQHHTIVGIAFEHDVEEGIDVLLERLTVDGDDNVLRLKTQ